jgi:hypothetical protein
MIRTIVIAAAAVAAFAVSHQNAAAQGTVRIEPRPFYGAVVTLEEGVRVFRPLPPDRYVIINPGNRTPLSISINDTRINERRIIQHQNDGASDGVVYRNGVSHFGVGRGWRYRARHGHGMGH